MSEEIFWLLFIGNVVVYVGATYCTPHHHRLALFVSWLALLVCEAIAVTVLFP